MACSSRISSALARFPSSVSAATSPATRSRLNLLLLEPGERRLDPRDPRVRHVHKVLRASAGDRLRAGEIGGAIGTALIAADSSDGLELDFRPERDPAPLAPVELLLGHPRPIVLKRMLRDLSALGLARIVVVPTELGEKSYYDSNLWSEVRTPLVEGAAQGGSTLIPELVRAGSLADGVAALESPRSGRFVLHPDGVAASIFDPVPAPHDVALCAAVGSERGWTEEEIELMADAGFRPASLGPRILRTENAALIAVWAAIVRCGEES